MFVFLVFIFGNFADDHSFRSRLQDQLSKAVLDLPDPSSVLDSLDSVRIHTSHWSPLR